MTVRSPGIQRSVPSGIAAGAASLAGLITGRAHPAGGRELLLVCGVLALLFVVLVLRQLDPRGSRILPGRRLPARRLFSALTFLSVALAGWARYPPLPTVPDALRSGTRLAVVGLVLDTTEYERGTGQLLVRPLAAGRRNPGRLPDLRLAVTLRGSRIRVPVGAIVLLRGSFVPPADGPANPGQTAPAAWMRRRGIAGTLRVRTPQDLVVVGGPSRARGPSVGRMVANTLERIRERYRATARAHLRGAPAGLYLGMILGDRESVPPRISDAMSTAGTAHLLAVSGLHVGFVAALVFGLSRTLRLDRSASCLVSIPLVALYAALTGGRASVVRAAVMAAAILGATLSGRRVHALQALGVSACVLLFARPTAWEEGGFRLSYGAVGTLLLAGPLLTSITRRARALPVMGSAAAFLAAGACASLTAQAGVLPFLLQVDGRIALVSPFANLAAVPLAALAVPLGLALPAIDALCAPWGRVWGAAVWALLQGIISVSVRSADLPGASWCAGSPPGWAVPAYYTGLVAMLRGGGRLRAAASALFVIALTAMAGPAAKGRETASPAPSARLLFLDVGQGDACLITSSAGSAILVDGGPRTPSYDPGRRVILPVLRRAGVRRLDLVVLTHPHLDHLGGLAAVLRGIPVGTLLDGAPVTPSPGYLDLLVTARDRGIRHRRARVGERVLDDGALTVDVLHGAANDTAVVPVSDLNDVSVALDVACEGVHVLLCGDLGRGELDRLAADHPALRLPLLPAPHHGSRGSVSPDLYTRVRGGWVLVSADMPNRFRFPHRETLAAARAIGARTWWTGRDGALELRVGTGSVTWYDAAGNLVGRRRIPPPSYRRLRR